MAVIIFVKSLGRKHVRNFTDRLLIDQQSA